MPAVTDVLTGSNFTVDLGDVDRVSTGFATVVFPPFAVAPDVLVPQLLTLRRAATGALDLYDWWNAARQEPKATLRTVTVRLMSHDFKAEVLQWRFIKARPVSLDYGSLDANAPAIVSETLVLAYERVEMGAVKLKPPRASR